MASYSLVVVPQGNPNDPWDRIAMEMAVVHNMLIRSINAILENASTVPKDKIKAFMLFCETSLSTLHHHHDAEEEFLFPFLEERMGQGTLQANVDQHHAFAPHLQRFESYIADVKTNSESYDGDKLKELLHAFAVVLVPHLTEEIPTLHTDLIRASVSREDLNELSKGVEARIKDSFKMDTVVPWALTCIDRNADPWFAFPTVLLYIVNWWPWYAPKYKDAWTFGPFDTWGRVKK